MASQQSLSHYGFVRIDDMTIEEIQEKGLVPISDLTSETTSNVPSNGNSSRRPRIGRPRVVTLLPPMSPTRRAPGRPEKYVNWFQDGLFPPILQAMKDSRGNYSKCIRLLRSRYKNGLTSSSPYDALSRSTLSSWFHRKTKKLLPHVAAHVESKSPYSKRTRFSIFGSTEIVEGLKEIVEKQRELGNFVFLVEV